MKALLFAENMNVYLENLKECADKLLSEWISKFTKVTGHSVQKSIVFLHFSNNYREKESLKNVIYNSVKKTSNMVSFSMAMWWTTLTLSGLFFHNSMG